MVVEVGNFIRNAEFVLFGAAILFTLFGDWKIGAGFMISVIAAEGLLWYLRQHSNTQPPTGFP